MSPRVYRNRFDRWWRSESGLHLPPWMVPRHAKRLHHIEKNGTCQSCCAVEPDCELSCVGFWSPTYGFFPPFPGDVDVTAEGFTDGTCGDCEAISIAETLSNYNSASCVRWTNDLNLCSVNGYTPNPCGTGCTYSALFRRVQGWIQGRDCDGSIDYRGVIDLIEYGYCAGFLCPQSEGIITTLTSDWFVLTGGETLQSIFQAGVTCDNVETNYNPNYPSVCTYESATGTLTYTPW